MKYLSVCSGVEAASLAWKPMGWECVGVSEIEKFPRAVLKHRIGAVPVDFDTHRYAPGQNHTPLFGDFTKIEEHHVGPVDLLVGGTPCQSFSVAGKRLGLDDPRGNLTLEFLALARRVSPRWIVWENVPGVLSHDGGRTFGTFLGLLAECGVKRWAYRVLDAQHVRVGRFGRAVPQRRRRVFVVGYLGDADLHPRSVLFDRESLRGHPAPRRETGKGASVDVAPSLVSSGRGVERIGETRGQDPVIAQAFGGGKCSGPIDQAATLTAKGQRIDFEVETFVAHTLRGEGFDASEDGTGRGTPIVPIAFDCKGTEVQYVTDGSHPTLRSMGHNNSHQNAGGHAAVAIQERAVSENPKAGPDGKGWRDDGAAYTLEARSITQAVATDWRVRRLTPTECERLMGFPDGHTKIPWRGKPAEQCPDGPRYKACGNSMAVNCMAWIGDRIAAVEAIHEDAS